MVEFKSYGDRWIFDSFRRGNRERKRFGRRGIQMDATLFLDSFMKLYIV